MNGNWKLILKINIYKITENNKADEAKACVKKYFKEASVDKELFVLIIRGINDNKLISKPIHAPSHEFAEIEIKVPIINVKKNSILAEFLKIKKKRIKTFISGVWAQ